MSVKDADIQGKSGTNKTKAAKIAMTAAFSLAVIKAVAGFMTGSLSVLASAVDSILDIISSFFNFVAIKKAEQPADGEHQFGHGKYESMAAFIQSLIIFAAGLMILVSAWNKFRFNQVAEVSTINLWVMIVSIGVTIFLTVYLRYTAKKENSAALEADAAHYSVDLYTNIGILAGLALMKLTGLSFIDPLIAAATAVYIMYSALRLSFDVSKILLDTRVEEETYKKLINVLESFDGYHKDFHKLRTRSSGQEKFIDMHMTLCSKLTLGEVHKIIDEIEAAIRKEIPDADITIHPEPCDHEVEGYDHSSCNSERVKAGIVMLNSRGQGI
ncbi:MAG: cation transporter [Deferribacterales bacterium]|nr:cation transporter [Deferribacterales bacterium]